MDDVTTNSVPWYQSITDTIAKAGTVLLNLEQQKQLNDINTQRAAQGLAPLDASQYQAGVNVGISSSTQNTLMLIAGGVLLTILATSFLSKRR